MGPVGFGVEQLWLIRAMWRRGDPIRPMERTWVRRCPGSGGTCVNRHSCDPAIAQGRSSDLDGIAVNALMPGNIASTALMRHLGADDLANLGKETDLTLPPVKTIEQGAATSVLVAASPEVEGVTGRYYEDCAQAPVVQERAGHTGGVAPYALNPDNADRLWKISEQLTH